MSPVYKYMLAYGWVVAPVAKIVTKTKVVAISGKSAELPPG